MLSDMKFQHRHGSNSGADGQLPIIERTDAWCREQCPQLFQVSCRMAEIAKHFAAAAPSIA